MVPRRKFYVHAAIDRIDRVNDRMNRVTFQTYELPEQTMQYTLVNCTAHALRSPCFTFDLFIFLFFSHVNKSGPKPPTSANAGWASDHATFNVFSQTAIQLLTYRKFCDYFTLYLA